MNKNLNKHIKSDKAKWIITSIVLVLVIVMLVGMCLQLFGQGKAKPSEWFNKTDELQEDQIEQVENVLSTSSPSMYSMDNKSSTISSVVDSDYVSQIKYDGAGPEELPIYGCGHLGDDLKFSGFVVPVYFVSNLEHPHNFSINEIHFPGCGFDRIAPYIVNDPINGNYALSGISYKYSLSARDIFGVPENYAFGGVSVTTNFDVPWRTFRFDIDDENFTASVSSKFLDGYDSDFSVVVTFNYYPFVSLPEVPVKDGYDFVGWYYGTDDDCNGECVAYDNEPIYADTDLHAHYKIKTYWVKFEVNDGSSVSNMIVDWNTIVTLPTVTRVGYDLVEWQLADGTKYSNQPITSNTTLYAVWKIKTYNVTFYVDSVVYTTLEVEYGSNLLDIVSNQNLVIVSVFSDDANFSSETLETDGVITDLTVMAVEMDGVDKVVNTVKNHKWQIIVGVIGGIALIAVISGIIGGAKRKRR